MILNVAKTSFLSPMFHFTGLSGLLLLGGGGDSQYSAELWVPGDNQLCRLPNIGCSINNPTCWDGGMMEGASVGWLGGAVYACYMFKCFILTASGWEAGPDLMNKRQGSRSVVTSQGLLITGGFHDSLKTTEVVSETGSKSSFQLSSEMQMHCIIQTSSSSIVLIGGSRNPSQVLEYSGLDGPDAGVTSTALPNLNIGRDRHGCGSYEHHGTLVGSSLVSDT